MKPLHIVEIIKNCGKWGVFFGLKTGKLTHGKQPYMIGEQPTSFVNK